MHSFYLKLRRVSFSVKESLDTMKTWLGIIKQGQFVHRDPMRIKDKYYYDGALKKSLNLVELTEEELLNNKEI